MDAFLRLNSRRESDMAAETRSGDCSEINEAARRAATRLSQDLSRTAEDARSAVAELAQAIGREAMDSGGEALSRTRGAMEERLRRHPITWVAGAASAGVLVGLLLGRRR